MRGYLPDCFAHFIHMLRGDQVEKMRYMPEVINGQCLYMADDRFYTHNPQALLLLLYPYTYKYKEDK
jgi:hypothetical protein